MLTLKELKKIVKVADVEKRIPSVKSLKEHKVVVKEMINADTTISVYDHGYVLYTAGNQSTVFPLHSCDDYEYVSVTGDNKEFNKEFFDNENWYIRLLMEAEDRMAYSQSKISTNHGVFSNSDVTDDAEIMRGSSKDFVDDVIDREILNALIKELTERQKTVLNLVYFEEMRQRLKDNAEEKLQYEQENKELIRNISHDLKTPITAIKGYVEGIMDGVASSPEKLDKYIRTIYNKANDMQRLIDELTFYSKIDTNRIPYNFRKINVSDYFGDCAEEVGLDLGAKNIVFQYANYVDEQVMVIADPEQIRRVVNNIISNSCKYFDKSQCFINMRIKDVGDFIQVEIEDNGKGIATKDIPYIFDRFYRTDSSRNSAKGGSGIGLSIVRKILEDHGGKVWASSKEGTGTVVYFVLRKYQENVQNVESAEAGDTDEKTKVKEAKTKEQKLTKESGTGKVVFTQDNSSKNSTHIMQMRGKERKE